MTSPDVPVLYLIVDGETGHIAGTTLDAGRAYEWASNIAGAVAAVPVVWDLPPLPADDPARSGEP